MTPVDKIKEMLQDPDSADKDIDYLIWCFISGNEPVDPPSDYRFDGPDYTTLLDQAMTIGADELSEWGIYINQYGEFFRCILSKSTTSKEWARSERMSSMPRAICFARIEALEYVRGV